ncbi:uncharacterized protein BXZ73DRAFT_97578 [Epithele typhae]|uniref:uncharacterized protein n=1 Tax=Epithele typhae TaxID=378194 RepID=UPI002007DE92|nr:uncharacterized protein BXZ73DRAFT_97578 [Epithele typhae]KAH9942157.1 hypothetical protein BXZ73DRAFT_97578 [Epithele typhae]
MTSGTSFKVEIVDDPALHYSLPLDQISTNPSNAPDQNLNDDETTASKTAWNNTMSIIVQPVTLWYNFTGVSRVALYGAILRPDPSGGTASANYNLDGNTTHKEVPFSSFVIPDYPLFVSEQLDPGRTYNLSVDVTANAQRPYLVDYLLLYNDFAPSPINSATATSTATQAPQSIDSILKPYVWPVIGALGGGCALLLAVVLVLSGALCKRRKKDRVPSWRYSEPNLPPPAVSPQPSALKKKSSMPLSEKTGLPTSKPPPPDDSPEIDTLSRDYSYDTKDFAPSRPGPPSSFPTRGSNYSSVSLGSTAVSSSPMPTLARSGTGLTYMPSFATAPQTPVPHAFATHPPLHHQQSMAFAQPSLPFADPYARQGNLDVMPELTLYNPHDAAFADAVLAGAAAAATSASGPTAGTSASAAARPATPVHVPSQVRALEHPPSDSKMRQEMSSSLLFSSGSPVPAPASASLAPIAVAASSNAPAVAQVVGPNGFLLEKQEVRLEPPTQGRYHVVNEDLLRESPTETTGGSNAVGGAASAERGDEHRSDGESPPAYSK